MSGLLLFQSEEILPRQTQQHDSLPLWQMAQTDLKNRLARERSGKPYSLFVFLLITIHLFTLNKKISNTVR
jgi:hypothetical protein